MKGLVAGVALGSVALGVAPAWAEEVPAAAPRPLPVAAEVEADDAAYDPIGKRDPFQPPRARAAVPVTGERSPLQRYELGQLRLVAVIYDMNNPRAVVEDEAGLGYIVKVGTQIGVNGGVVRTIDRGRVLVEEESKDFFGEQQLSKVTLEMASGERGSR
jgi:type IV pilus assembly protein PilP